VKGKGRKREGKWKGRRELGRGQPPNILAQNRTWAGGRSRNRIFAARIRAVITNGHTAWARTQGPGFFFFLIGPQLAVVKESFF